MRRYLERKTVQWAEVLPSLTLAYNSKQHTATGVTPFLAFYGREVRLPVDLMLALPVEKVTIHENVRHMLDRVKTMYWYISEKGEAVLRRNAATYTGNQNPYKMGEWIWYLSPRGIPGKPNKIVNRWIGPYKVVGVVSEVLLKIVPALHEGQVQLVHIGRVREFHGDKTDVKYMPKGPRTEIIDHDIECETVGNAQPAVDRTALTVPIRYPVAEQIIIDIPKTASQKRPAAKTESNVSSRTFTETPAQGAEATPFVPTVSIPEKVPDEILHDDSMQSESHETAVTQDTEMTETTLGKPSRKRGSDENLQATERDTPIGTAKVARNQGIKRTRSNKTGTEPKRLNVEESHKTAGPTSLIYSSDEGDMSTMTSKAVRNNSALHLGPRSDCEIQPNETLAIDTGISLQMARDYHARIDDNPALTKDGIMVCGGHTPDCATFGTLRVVLHNSTKQPYRLSTNQCIAKLTMQHQNNQVNKAKSSMFKKGENFHVNPYE